MLKFEQVDEWFVFVKVGELKIAVIRKMQEQLYSLDVCTWFRNSCDNLWNNEGQLWLETLEAAQDKITAKWNEWLDKAGLQVKQ